MKETQKKQKDFAKTDSVILVFTAGYADMCYFTYPLWYKFAAKYTTSKVKFYEVDVNKFPSLAKTCKVSGQFS